MTPQERAVVDAAVAHIREMESPAMDLGERHRTREALSRAVAALEEARYRQEVMGTWAPRPIPETLLPGIRIGGIATPKGTFKPSDFEVTLEQLRATGNRENGAVIDEAVRRLTANAARLREFVALRMLTLDDAQAAMDEMLGAYGLEPQPLFERLVDERGDVNVEVIVDEASEPSPSEHPQRIGSATGHFWPCARFYTSSSDRDPCTCGAAS